MLRIVDFSKLRREVSAYEGTCFEDLRIFGYQIIGQIRFLIESEQHTKDLFFSGYIHDVILPDLEMYEDFLRDAHPREERIEFKVRSLKYHLQFIIDSCIYASMVNQKE
jgi:hypothetical protein